MTKTEIKPLKENESIEELCRIISGTEITEAVKESAVEMKEAASQYKK